MLLLPFGQIDILEFQWMSIWPNDVVQNGMQKKMLNLHNLIFFVKIHIKTFAKHNGFFAYSNFDCECKRDCHFAKTS